MTRNEIIDLICKKADEYGIERWELLGGLIAESNLDPNAWRQRTWPDWSAGLGQQTVKFADEGDHTASPENVALIQRLYFDPVHAIDVAATKFLYWRHNPDVPALTAWVAYNSPGYYRTPAESPNAANYSRGLAEAQIILGAPPVPSYNLAYPIRPQDHDWDCFEESANWALHAAGRNPSDAWLEAQMLADGVESTANGLEDESGAQAARWITSEYSDPGEGTPTLKAYNASSVTFDDVKSVAGRSPVLLGGHHWGSEGHWSGVRGYDAAQDVLLLANPANGYAGVGQTMTRQQFAQVGPCSMVVLMADGSVGPADPPPPPVPAPITRADLQPIYDALGALLERAPG